MSQHRPASSPRRRSSRRRSSERGGTGADVVPPPPYLVEWSAQTCRQRGIPDVDALREEMGAPERPGWRRLVVMRGREDEVDAAVWLGLGEARGRGRGRGRRAAGWAWEYPEVEVDAEVSTTGRMGVGDGEREGDCVERRPTRQGIRLCRAALSTKTRIPILLLDGLPPSIPQRAPRPSRHGPQRRRSSVTPVEPPPRSGLEDALWAGLGADARPLEELLAGLAYEAWLDALPPTSPPREGDAIETLWEQAQSLEANADAARAMERRGAAPGPGAVTAADWTALAERLHRRMHLSAALSLRLNNNPPPATNANARSLDRIAYLGGLLFPATVVSGILSIEGTYGPEGSAFWVFWLAAGLSSIFAVLVIYADNLRTLDVWIEVAAGEVDDALLLHRHHHHHHHRQRRGGDEERGEAGVTTTAATGDGVYVVQRRGDGSEGRAWRRKELGWLGAVKKMSGWYSLRGSPGMEFRMPGAG